MSKETRKWKIVEQVVAAAFDAPDVQVQKNVKLPSIRRKGGIGGGREIDVLITGRLVERKRVKSCITTVFISFPRIAGLQDLAPFVPNLNNQLRTPNLGLEQEKVS